VSITKVDKKNGLVLEFLDYMNNPTEHTEWEKRCEGKAPNVRCAYEDFSTNENYESPTCSCPMLMHNAEDDDDIGYCEYAYIESSRGWCEILVSVKEVQDE